MTRIGTVVCGLTVVAIDIRFGAFDILPDVVGWAMVAIALSGLNARTSAFGLTAVFCGLAAVLSLVDLAQPVRSASRTSLVFGTASDSGAGASSVVAASAIFSGVAFALICWAVGRAAGSVGDTAAAARFSVLTIATAVSGSVTAVLALTHPSQFPASLVLPLVALEVALFVCVLVSLMQVRQRDYLTVVVPQYPF